MAADSVFLEELMPGTTDTSKKAQQQKPPMRIQCPNCGNDSDFVEVADGVIITTRYLQNEDGSFTQEDDDSQIHGEIKFYCGECNADLSQFHQRFLDMLF